MIWPATLGLYRKRPVNEIVNDLASLQEDYVYLGDDNTFADAKWADTLADAIAAAGIRKELSSYCRVDHICKHPELLKKWYDIGLRYLVVGVEAVSSERLKRFNKKTSHEQNKQAIRALRDIGIFAIPHILISPEMTADDFDDIYDFVEENEFEYPVAIPLTPLPGTQDHQQYHAQGRIMTDKLDFYTFMYNVIRPTHLDPREYDRLYDRLIFRMWSWNRYLSGKCGRTSFVAFLKWWPLRARADLEATMATTGVLSRRRHSHCNAMSRPVVCCLRRASWTQSTRVRKIPDWWGQIPAQSPLSRPL